MCGIAGIFHLEGQETVSRKALARMVRTLVHRGPDDEGLFFEGPVGFGVRRLSIVDRAQGHQPLTSEDGSTWIAFNGEIYNHPNLRQFLLARGHTYRTNCDTETVVHAYEEYGDRLVEHLRGMFAFSLWDGRKKQLLLYRDRLGIKPLYYCVINNTLVFASEVKAILAYGVPFAVEERVLECYLRLGYVPGDQTLFRHIYKLPPGHFLVADIGKPTVRLQRYWGPRFESAEMQGEADYVEEFGHLLEETVAQHRLGEVPQGIFLSGGVDSSALVAVAAGQVSEPVLTFSVGYADQQSHSEFPYARRVASLFRTRHLEYVLSGKNFAESLPRLIWHMDEPVADPAAIPLFFIAQLAREHATVVHSGEGADEILGGYSIYRKMRWISELQKFIGAAGTGILGRCLRFPWLPYRLTHYAELLARPLPTRYQGVRRLLTEGLLRQIARNSFPSSADSHYRHRLFENLYSGSQGQAELNRMLSVDLQAWLPDDLLIKADKMTMAASIELRVPFLDHRIVEFAGRLPCHLKVRDGQTKYLLKEVMRKRLPAEILMARKRGFPIPIGQWLRGELYRSAQSWLLDSPLLRGLFKRHELEKLLRIQRSGRQDLHNEIYGLICLAVWHDVFAQRYERESH